MRLDAPLYFLNANVARSQILDLVKGGQPTPKAVLFDLGASADLDVASLDMLRNLVGELEEAGSGVLLVQVRGSVRDRLRKSGIMAEIARIASTGASPLRSTTSSGEKALRLL